MRKCECGRGHCHAKFYALCALALTGVGVGVAMMLLLTFMGHPEVAMSFIFVCALSILPLLNAGDVCLDHMGKKYGEDVADSHWP